MPAKNPRLNVTVTSDQHSLLLELGTLQNRSAASFLREMLDAATPMLEALLPVYRQAAAQEAFQPQALQLAIKDALSSLDTQTAQLDLLRLIGETTIAPSNDLNSPGDGTAPSVARADASPAIRRPGKRS